MITLALACMLSLQPHYPLCNTPEPVFLQPKRMTTAQQMRTKTVILGTFPDNQAAIDALHGKPAPRPVLKKR